MKQCFVLIPGHKESLYRTKRYLGIIEYCKDKQIDLFGIDIDRKDTNINDRISQCNSQLDCIDFKHYEKVIVLGFSFGAMTLLGSNVCARANKSWVVCFCGFSPFFKENIDGSGLMRPFESWLKELGPNMVNAFRSFSIQSLKHYHQQLTFIRGSKEYKRVIQASQFAMSLNQGSKCFVLEGKGHDVPGYGECSILFD